jgi:transcriptional regulatory protein LevR
LHSTVDPIIVRIMGLPKEPVIVTPGEVEELNGKLSLLRHNVNNHLSLILAATELIRRKPESANRMADTVALQPQKIIDEIRRFSDELEKALQITKEPRSAPPSSAGARP